MRDHRGVVHALNYLCEVDAGWDGLWVSPDRVRELIRTTTRQFKAVTMCDVTVKIHHRTVTRLDAIAWTCLSCVVYVERNASL